MTSTASLVVRSLEPSDEPAVLDLLGAALAGGPTGSRTGDFFRWKHVDNPFGRSPGLVATDAGRVVGLRLFLRWEFRCGKEVVRAVRPVDTATHPDYQGRGIFKKLTLALIDSLAGEADLIFNTPNEQSLPGYLKMGWEPVGLVPIHIRPVRWGRFLRRFRSAGRGQPPGDTGTPRGVIPMHEVLRDPRLPTLLRSIDPGVDELRMHTPRTLEFLHWRYGQPPGLAYHAVTVQRDGELTCVAIGRVRQRGALREFTLGDVICIDSDRGSAWRALRAAARLDVDHVAMHAAPDTPAASVRRAAGYLQVPRGGMRLVAKPLAPMTPDPMALASWRLSLGDLEVF